jgi:hypothetical protein
MPSVVLRFREYVEAAKLARHRAQSERNPHAKQILQEIERSYHRLVEIENGRWTSNNITAHLLISDCSTVRLPSARTSCSVRQTRIKSPARPLEIRVEDLHFAEF